MTQGSGIGGQVEQVTDNDVDENTKIVGVEVFESGGVGEEEVEEFEDLQLKGCFICERGEKQ